MRSLRRGRPATRRALGVGLLASTLALCGANWGGTYEGSDAGAHRMILQGEADSLTVQLFRVTIDDASGCWLRIQSCPALLDPDGGGFSAGPCPAFLVGPDDTCSGSIDLRVRGTAMADNGTAVTAVQVQSTLDDWPVVVRRVRACGLGVELVVLAPLLGTWRRSAPATGEETGSARPGTGS